MSGRKLTLKTAAWRVAVRWVIGDFRTSAYRNAIVALIGVTGLVACGEREGLRSAEQVTNPGLPGDAGADGNGATSSNHRTSASTGSSTNVLLQDAGSDDAGTTVEPRTDAATQTNEPTAGESTSERDAGSLNASACIPSQCVCPDPSSEDCCNEFLPYRNAVLATPEEVEANAGGMVDPDDLPPVAEFTTLTKEELWEDFSAGCGTNSGCHVGTDRTPNDALVFQVTFETFDARPTIGEESLQRVKGIGGSAMPVGAGDDATKRGCTNRWVRLGEALYAYQRSGWQNEFQVPRCPEEIAAEEQEREENVAGSSVCGLLPHPYALDPSVALNQTNLGQCIPNHTTFCPEADLKAKDDAFASYQSTADLPTSIRGTDLVSLDSAVLAKHRVYSYSPTYTLFSDNAKKQRYVRVPVGKTIKFNPQTNDFDIPENTRFYKTFLKPVITETGEKRYRKIETRLIVARRNVTVNGVSEVRSLRATYAWDNEEREAKIVTDQRKDGQPWADRLCPLIVNESGTRDEDAHPVVTSNRDECQYITDEELADPSSGFVRHYAIPGSQRCDECHMGANNRSYVLGFSPWAADHRPMGEGGVFEPQHADELSQLRRLLEYGVVEGIEPGQAKLEESQGERKPRNDYELKAQAYMLGNCAYCHNPNGFPSVQNPILRNLDFYPQKTEAGGIFQFPLETESPRARTGRAQLEPIRYITTEWGYGQIEGSLKTEEKSLEIRFEWVNGVWPDVSLLNNTFEYLAPWRSLIWRNVYTPFTYPDDSAMYIHMPRNVPGFDCRAHNIMADWMLSIPVNDQGEEIQPGTIPLADANAARRVEAYHASGTGQHCPADDDILDPSVLRHDNASPIDTGDLNTPRINREAIALEFGKEHGVFMFKDSVPDHAHWVAVDFSSPLDRWEPKRRDWKDVLLGNVPPASELLGRTIEDINTVHLSQDQESFSLEKIPMGVWSEDCRGLVPADLSTSVAQVLANQTSDTRWVGYTDAQTTRPVPADAEIHSMSRGQAVFELICQNCHGVNYDSKSALATTVGELSGGDAIVANFRTGLFGPELSPGAFADAEFTFANGNNGASAEDWQARYVLFMGLGGTQAAIPQAVLDLISSSAFYGQVASTVGAASEGTSFGANMLQPAQSKCLQIINTPSRVDLLVADKKLRPYHDMAGLGTPFAPGTGHYQLFEGLCNYGQAPIVRVLTLPDNSISLKQEAAYFSRDRAQNPIYPADALVGDQMGNITMGIQGDNRLPWCVQFTEQTELAMEGFGYPSSQVPWCPDALFSAVSGVQINKVPGLLVEGLQDGEGKERWLRRGAINAGLAAFYYMDRRSKGLVTAVPAWDAPNCGAAASP